MLTLSVNSIEYSFAGKVSLSSRVGDYWCINIFRKIWFLLLCRLDNLQKVRGKYEKHKCGPVAGDNYYFVLIYRSQEFFYESLTGIILSRA